jgi:hypothetical protein
MYMNNGAERSTDMDESPEEFSYQLRDQSFFQDSEEIRMIREIRELVHHADAEAMPDTSAARMKPVSEVS